MIASTPHGDTDCGIKAWTNVRIIRITVYSLSMLLHCFVRKKPPTD